MNSFAALCDDLTGSSVQSILLKDRGVPVRQLIRLTSELPPPEEGEALVINCDSRRRPPEEVSRIFHHVISSLPPGISMAKRIDTTLRGHLFLETAELLKARPHALALVVPAYPSSGRTTVGGYHLLSGALLERTEVARDPLWPISTSLVSDYFKGPFALGALTMETVRGGEEAIAAELDRMASQGVRIVTADALTDEDIDRIAAGAAGLDREIIPVDPGPFSAAFLSRRLLHRSGGFVLAVIGSTSEKTAGQLAFLDGKVRREEFTLSAEEEPKEALSRFQKFLSSLSRKSMEFLLIRPEARKVRGREDATAKTLALLGRSALEMSGEYIQGIILSGGDTAAVFFEEAGQPSCFRKGRFNPSSWGEGSSTEKAPGKKWSPRAA
ncbi:four-carbon acid sugar kinase family protein [Aminivibrio sp.]